MWSKNGSYQITHHKEVHNIPRGYKSHKNKTTEENMTNITIECNLDYYSLFAMIVVGLYAPLPIAWKVFIIASFIIKCFSIHQNEV